MKQAFLFSVLIICISCFSCKKDEIKSYKKSLIGNWDWEKSETGNNGGTYTPLITHSPSTTGENYGVRIKRNDEVILYKNGKQIKKGKLEGVVQDSYFNHDFNGDISVIYYYKITIHFEDETMIFNGDNMSCKTWPYTNCPNFFTKIK